MRVAGAAVCGCALVLLGSAPAAARHGGIYFELAPAWGFFSTEEVIVEEGNDTFSDFPIATFVPQLKFGVNLFGWAGAEAHVLGHYWDLEGDPGGGGFVGGTFRITPLEVLTYALPPDSVQIPSLFPPGPVEWKDRPFDLGISFGGGYTLLGEDYAYQGGYFQWGFDVKFFITPNFAIGLDFPFRHLLYEPFRYSDFADRRGFCTDGGDAFGIVAGQKVPVTPAVGRNTFFAAEVAATEIDTTCAENDARPPAAFFFAPSFTIAGVFDFGV